VKEFTIRRKDFSKQCRVCGFSIKYRDRVRSFGSTDGRSVYEHIRHEYPRESTPRAVIELQVKSKAKRFR